MRSISVRLSALAVLALLGTHPLTADVVRDWNAVLLGAVRVDRTPPPKASRAMAMTHVAMYDSVVGALGGYEPYAVTEPAGPLPLSAEAAAAAAAHMVLGELFPAQQATFDAALTSSLATIPDGAAETNGIAWGHHVAAAILALRAADGAAAVVPYSGPEGASWWEPTPPAFAAPAFPNWPYVMPWSLARGSELRAPAPPAPMTAEYAAAFDEVKRLGAINSLERTADQTEIALFWADGPGTATPPGHWHEIAQQIAEREGLSLVASARLFALLAISEADAAIAAWDMKYTYGHWRPITGIREAASDGNPATVADASWTPFITTPNFPAYVSGHSTFSGAAARLLGLFFDGDDFAFDTTTAAMPGVERSFTGFWQAAEEAGQSRIYGGIHWQYDNRVGLEMGRRLAEQVYFSHLAPIETPGPCLAETAEPCLLGDRYRVKVDWAAPTFTGGGTAIELGRDSAGFWFFSPDNVEVVVKVLDGCAINDAAWIFVGGVTDLEVTVTVVDTWTGRTRRYFNPGGRPFTAIRDVHAFANCS